MTDSVALSVHEKNNRNQLDHEVCDKALDDTFGPSRLSDISGSGIVVLINFIRLPTFYKTLYTDGKKFWNIHIYFNIDPISDIFSRTLPC